MLSVTGLWWTPKFGQMLKVKSKSIWNAFLQYHMFGPMYRTQKWLQIKLPLVFSRKLISIQAMLLIYTPAVLPYITTGIADFYFVFYQWAEANKKKIFKDRNSRPKSLHFNFVRSGFFFLISCFSLVLW